MIDLVTGRFEIVQYDDEKAIYIANLVETMWLYRYSIPMEITYDQGSEFIGDKYRKYLIEEEYGITSKPSTLVNNLSNVILECTYRVLGNLVRTFNISQTYVDKNYPWTDILAAAEFAIHSTINRQKIIVWANYYFSMIWFS